MPLTACFPHGQRTSLQLQNENPALQCFSLLLHGRALRRWGTGTPCVSQTRSRGHRHLASSGHQDQQLPGTPSAKSNPRLRATAGVLQLPACRHARRQPPASQGAAAGRQSSGHPASRAELFAGKGAGYASPKGLSPRFPLLARLPFEA